jgi:predicted site-specific integrase-resolvase
MMSGNSTETVYPQVLRTWRSIAQYLGVSERTARRWHKRFRLPVVRLVGKRVFTSTGAIDHWIERVSALEHDHRKKREQETARNRQ